MRASNMPTPMVVLLVALAAVWGSAFTLIEVLVDDMTPIEIAAGRLALGAATVLALLAVRGSLRLPARGLIGPIALLALLDSVGPYMLVGWAQSRIEGGEASVLVSAMPLFTVILASLVLTDERLSPARVAGIAIGFTGVLAMVGSPAAGTSREIAGQLAVVGAAISYAAAAVYARVLLRRIDAPNLTAWKLAAGAAVASVATLAAGGGGGIAGISVQDAAALAALGVVCTGFSFLAYFRILAGIGSVGASTVTYMIPVFGLLVGAFALGETIDARTLTGMGLILSGVAGVMYPRLLTGALSRVRAVRPTGAPA